jgi:stage III sporulation protein AG
MEDRLARALSKIDGAGTVTVVLTVRDGPRQVLAQDSREEQGETETVVISRGSSTQETVTVQELYPSHQGALLVCPGGDDPTVRLKLTEATSALTGLGADRISISKGK